MKRYMKESEAMEYIDCGRTFCRSWGKEIGAVVHLGNRSIRYDRTVIDAHLNANREQTDNIQINKCNSV